MSSARDDELDAIYSDSVNINNHADEVKLVAYKDENVSAKFYLSKDYPTVPPVLEFSLSNRARGAIMNNRILEETSKIFFDNIGSEVLFQCIEYLRSSCSNDDCDSQVCLVDEEEDKEFDIESEALMHHGVESITTSLASGVRILHGQITNERRSTFQAHMARVKTIDDVRVFRAELLSDKRIAKATHNIFAYRFTCSKSGAVYHDCDDDGESAAGAKLAEVLRLMSADGVAVIVSRWYGGIKLGPSRFKFINNAARNVLESNGFGS